MLIKTAEDQTPRLTELQRLVASTTGAESKRHLKEFNIRKAGIKGEAESAYLINFDFEKTANWAVIHDLRLEHGSRVAQVDHLLINRWLECYVLESKHFNAGIKITEAGEFMRWNAYKRTYEGMASPLEQNQRHTAVIGDVMRTLRLPVRFGRAIEFSFQTFVLVSPSARIDRPKNFDSSRVVKADQLRTVIKRDIDSENGLLMLMRTAARIVSAETLHDVAKQLARKHKPLSSEVRKPSQMAAPIQSPPVVAAHKVAESPAPIYQALPTAHKESVLDGPVCKACSKTEGAIQYSKFGYYFHCAGCEANTSIKFQCQPGHKPRLRKRGDHFHRVCADCGTEALYFLNRATA